MYYYDDPEFFKGLFRKLLDSLEASQKIDSSFKEDMLYAMRYDGGPGVPFELTLGRLIESKILMSDDEFQITKLIAASGDHDEFSEYEEMMQAA